MTISPQKHKEKVAFYKKLTITKQHTHSKLPFQIFPFPVQQYLCPLCSAGRESADGSSPPFTGSSHDSGSAVTGAITGVLGSLPLLGKDEYTDRAEMDRSAPDLSEFCR